MNHKLTVTLALAAGFAGGLLSQYITPVRVHAQGADRPTLRLIQAQSFVLVDQAGSPRGSLSVDQKGTPIISFTDQGKTVWLDLVTPFMKNAKPLSAPPDSK